MHYILEIIQHGRCDMLEASAEGNTVFHVAAEHGHDDMIRQLYLRSNKGLISRRNSALDTPLHCTARAGHVEALAVLVELARGEEDILGRKNEAGDTVLHLAARHGHGVAVEFLVSAETTASELNNAAGVSPLYLAVMSGSVHAVRVITSSCRNASAAGPSAQNALHAAVFQSSEMVQLLMEWRPALADQVDCNGSTPLHFASSDGHRPTVRAILHAAPPRTAYRKDRTGGLSALHVAARMGHHGVIKELIGSCPDAGELRDDGGGTFLHAAAKEKRSSVVSLAVKDPMLRGLLDARDREGNTPLHLAVAAGAPRIVDILMRKGKVRADVLNDDGQTPFDIAKKSTSFFTMVNLVTILVAFRAQFGPQRQDLLEPWNDRHIRQKIEKSSDSLSVVAGLIVAASLAAGFQLPGGYGDDGTAVLKDKPAFKIFLFFNSVTVVTAVVTVVLLVYGKAASRSAGSFTFALPLHCFWISLNSLMLAFSAGLTAVTDKLNRFVLVAVYVCIQVLILFILRTVSHARLRYLLCSLLNTRHQAVAKRQYPLAAASGVNLIPFLVLNYVVSFGFGF